MFEGEIKANDQPRFICLTLEYFLSMQAKARFLSIISVILVISLLSFYFFPYFKTTNQLKRSNIDVNKWGFENSILLSNNLNLKHPQITGFWDTITTAFTSRVKTVTDAISSVMKLGEGGGSSVLSWIIWLFGSGSIFTLLLFLI